VPTTTFAHRPSFIHDEGATHEIFAVERLHSLFGGSVIIEFSEAEAARLAGEAIAKQTERVGMQVDFRKQRGHFFVSGLERQISYVQFLHSNTPSARRIGRGCEAEVTVDRPRAARIEGFRTRLKRALQLLLRAYCSQIGEASTIRERRNARRMSHLRSI
jgi:hypothetical protein